MFFLSFSTFVSRDIKQNSGKVVAKPLLCAYDYFMSHVEHIDLKHRDSDKRLGKDPESGSAPALARSLRRCINASNRYIVSRSTLRVER